MKFVRRRVGKRLDRVEKIPEQEADVHRLPVESVFELVDLKDAVEHFEKLATRAADHINQLFLLRIKWQVIAQEFEAGNGDGDRRAHVVHHGVKDVVSFVLRPLEGVEAFGEDF